uniref:FAM192A/Fyv6 N-terminal domain-containing protein n=1 Tax=Ditylum brightwellii TaxID=49249 RepID=A0A6U3NRZ3_9STRA|mmetsp:Transcript_11707/g.17470  ORF Transcript_11707/g.17470 Transcript_11707/m.17470 type:complete len:242 (+) Transcript_11707:195-920(+)
MSLSFVSSAVLSSTDGVSHNEEKSIESKEVQNLRSRNSAQNKPLFEQLRSLKEEEQAKYDENTKAMMGMRTLDEEECAHLDAVERQRREQQDRVKAGVEEEVARFRAARADRRLVESFIEEDNDAENKDASAPAIALKTMEAQKKPAIVSIRPKITPKIVGKKKRKSTTNTEGGQKTKYQKKNSTTTTNDNVTVATNEKSETGKVLQNSNNKDDSGGDDEEGGLGGLLGCYGSDDDDSDEQ